MLPKFLLPILFILTAAQLRANDAGCKCGSDLLISVQRGVGSRATTTVTQTEYKFTTASITVNVGDTVTWTNGGTVAHTSTSDTGVWDSGAMNVGTSFSFTFTSAGTFPYHCSFHQGLGMVGTVTVNAAPPPPTPPAISSSLSATAIVNLAFNYTVQASGSTPVTFTASPLPDGLAFNGTNITGVPTTAGTFNVTLTATNSAGVDTQTLVIVVSATLAPGVTPPAPAAPTTNLGAVKFSVKSSDPNGSRSRFQIVKLDITAMASQLPKNKQGKPTFAGLSNLYLYLGSAAFSATIDAKGKVTVPFSARLSSTFLTLQAKGLNLVSLLNLDLASAGTKTAPKTIGIEAVGPSLIPIVLFSGFGGADTISYTVKNGTATAK